MTFRLPCDARCLAGQSQAFGYGAADRPGLPPRRA
jgi:hypothetical protein